MKLKVWLERLENKLQLILNKQVLMSAALGFTLGLMLPTYVLLKSNKIELGDVGEWAGAIATFLAVGVSLYLASSSDKADVRMQKVKFDSRPDRKFSSVEIINYGKSGTSIKLSLKLDEKFFESFIGQFDNDLIKSVKAASLSRALNSAIIDDAGNGIDHTNRYFIDAKKSFVVLIDTRKIINWLKKNSPLSEGGQLIMGMHDMNNSIQKERLDRIEFTSNRDMAEIRDS